MEIFGILIALGVAIWVYSDAQKRGKTFGSALSWSIGTFLLLIVFLPIWLITRPKFPEEMRITGSHLCKHCGKYYEGSPSYCPNCGNKIIEDS